MLGSVVLIVVGLMAVAVGAQEARTGQPVIPRLGGNRQPERDGWILVAIGAGMVLVALVLLLDLPWWAMGLVVVAAIAGAVWSVVTYRPRKPLGRKVDPPEDPDAAWKRNPPGY